MISPSFEVIPHPRVDLLEEVQRALDLSFFAHVRILHCEIFVDVRHDNATLTRLIECWTPYVHCLINRSKAVASIRFPETAISLREHTRHGSHVKVLDSNGLVRRPLRLYIDRPQHTEWQSADHI